MGAEYLRKRAQEILRQGVAEMRRTGGLTPAAYLVVHEGPMQVIPIEPWMMDDDSQKNRIATLIRRRALFGDVEAIMILSDTWVRKASGAKAGLTVERFGSVKEYRESARRGEAVAVYWEAAAGKGAMLQEYRREGVRIELVGEPFDVADAASPLGGHGFHVGFPQWTRTAGGA